MMHAGEKHACSPYMHVSICVGILFFLFCLYVCLYVYMLASQHESENILNAYVKGLPSVSRFACTHLYVFASLHKRNVSVTCMLSGNYQDQHLSNT